MKPITVFLFVFLLSGFCNAQTRIRFTKKSEPGVTRGHSYPARRMVKLMTPHGEWTRWSYCDSISAGSLFCGDTAYALHQFITVKIRKPRTISRILPFLTMVAAPVGLIKYRGISEDIIPYFVVSAAGIPLNIFGVVLICKQRPKYNLKEWNMIVE